MDRACGPHKKARRRRCLRGAVVFLVVWYCPAFSAHADPLLRVFAAASLVGVVAELAGEYTKTSGVRCIPVFGASSTLARQIRHGAPAHVYISANPQWMDVIDRAGLIVDGSRTDLVTNRLLLVAPAGSQLSVSFGNGNAIAKALGYGPLALGDPTHVPAGMYAKEALIRLGLWQAVDGRVARAANVRAALALVERGEAPLGVVYESDIVGREGVTRVAVFPADSHAKIVYPAAAIAGPMANRAREFLAFLQNDTARAIFGRYGFSTL